MKRREMKCAIALVIVAMHHDMQGSITATRQLGQSLGTAAMQTGIKSAPGAIEGIISGSNSISSPAGTPAPQSPAPTAPQYFGGYAGPDNIKSSIGQKRSFSTNNSADKDAAVKRTLDHISSRVAIDRNGPDDAEHLINPKKYPELVKFFEKYNLPIGLDMLQTLNDNYQNFNSPEKIGVGINQFNKPRGILFDKATERRKDNVIDRIINAQRAQNFIDQNNLDCLRIPKKYIYLSPEGKLKTVVERVYIKKNFDPITLQEMQQIVAFALGTGYRDWQIRINVIRDYQNKLVFLDTEDCSFQRSHSDTKSNTLSILASESRKFVTPQADAWLKEQANKLAESDQSNDSVIKLPENNFYDTDMNFDQVKEELQAWSMENFKKYKKSEEHNEEVIKRLNQWQDNLDAQGIVISNEKIIAKFHAIEKEIERESPIKKQNAEHIRSKYIPRPGSIKSIDKKDSNTSTIQNDLNPLLYSDYGAPATARAIYGLPAKTIKPTPAAQAQSTSDEYVYDVAGKYVGAENGTHNNQGERSPLFEVD